MLEKVNVGTEMPSFPPEDWRSVRDMKIDLKVAYDYILGVAKRYAKEHPEWVKQFRSRFLGHSGMTATYYHPELVELARKEAENSYRPPPNGWLNIEEISKVYRIPVSIIQEHLKLLGPEFQGNLCSASKTHLKFIRYYPPDAVLMLSESLNLKEFAPAGWVKAETVADMLDIPEKHAVRLLEKALKDNIGFAGNYLDPEHDKASNSPWRRFYHPMLVDKIARMGERWERISQKTKAA